MSQQTIDSKKREKFVQFAEKRTINALQAIRIIGKLGNKSAYEYTDKDVKQIVAALNAEVSALETRMKRSGRADTVEFNLKDK